tara:strand:+ start:2702 stop:2860 length:159 start_codon:yes stop_codon:yes gene_type:complete
MNEHERANLFQKAGDILIHKYSNTYYKDIPEKYKFLYKIYIPLSCGNKRKNN